MAALTPLIRSQMAHLLGILAELGEDDLVVFTARKAACAADGLRRAALWQPRSAYTSTRALDGDINAVAGRDVILVEDIASSGRTIKRSVERLREGSPRSIRCFAMTVEGDLSSVAGLEDIEFIAPTVQAALKDNLLHAQSIIRALWALPRPYNLDWPLFLVRADFDLTQLDARGWRLTRATWGPDHDGPFNLEVSLDAAADLLLPDSPGSDDYNSPDFCKVRFYPVPEPQDGGTRYVGVPIVALGPLDYDTIQSLVAAVSVRLGVDLAFHSAGESYRALQLIASQELYRAAFANTDSHRLDHEALQFLFLEPSLDRIVRALHAVDEQAARRTFPSLPIGRTVRSGATAFEAAVTNAQAEAATDVRLTDHFLATYLVSREYQLRSELARTSDRSERKSLLEELTTIDRFDHGASFTAKDLRAVLDEVVPAELLRAGGSAEALVSRYLDHAIDTGAVVPDQQDTGALICRRFRPGEVIDFERETESLWETALRTFSGEADRHRLSGDLVEKVGVGLFRYLISRDAFADHRGDGTSGDDDRMQIRYHLRGATVSSVAADFVAEPGNPPSLAVLERRRIISRVSRGYELPDNRAIEATSTHNLTALEFGSALGWLASLPAPAGHVASAKRRNARLMTEAELLLLLTLPSSESRALALGADVAIAHRQLRQGGAALVSGHPQAIRQGLRKAHWIRTDRQGRVLRAATDAMSAVKDPLRAAVMKSVIGNLDSSEVNTALERLAEKEASWFAQAYLHFAGVAFLAAGAEDPTTSAERVRDLKNRLKERDLTEVVSTLEGSQPIPWVCDPVIQLMHKATAEEGLVATDEHDLRRSLMELRNFLVSAGEDLLGECYGAFLSTLGRTDSARGAQACAFIFAPEASLGPTLESVLPFIGRGGRAVGAASSHEALPFGANAVVVFGRKPKKTKIVALLFDLHRREPGTRVLLLSGLPGAMRPVPAGHDVIAPRALRELASAIVADTPGVTGLQLAWASGQPWVDETIADRTAEPRLFHFGHSWGHATCRPSQQQLALSNDSTAESVAEDGDAMPGIRVMLSYAHEGEDQDWMRRVRKLARWLQEQEGFVVACDQFGDHGNRAWGTWGPNAIAEASAVICLASPQYKVAWGANRGTGAAAEARATRNHYQASDKLVVFALLEGRDRDDIPMDVVDHHWVRVPTIDEGGTEDLVRILRDAPRFSLGPPGTPRPLPAED